jgi:polysaccharide export outer membrane protein
MGSEFPVGCSHISARIDGWRCDRHDASRITMLRLITAAVLLLLAALPARPHAAAQAAGSRPSAAAPTSYTVGPDDVLKVTVVGEEKLSDSYKVDADGSINFPLLGRLVIGGMTVRQVESELATQLLKFLRRPQVLVEVEDYKSRHIYILGEVKQTGKYALQGEMTLLEMLALAGSANPGASSEAVVLRKRPGASADSAALPGESDEVARVNLNDLRSGKLVGSVLLQDGDTIYVPPADRFYVSGYVRNPGGYELKPGMTVEQAISLAGGITERGSNRRIKIRRQLGPNQYQEINAKMTDLVKPNDTIRVPQRLI